MARRSLRPHLNQIRTWVRQGRTDAWVAHQLEVTVQQIEAFKKENDLLPDGETDFAVSRRRFSREALETFLSTEYPIERSVVEAALQDGLSTA